MKTLILCTNLTYVLCIVSCMAIQPSNILQKKITHLFGESHFRTCQNVTSENVAITGFVEQEKLLCLGVKTFFEKFRSNMYTEKEFKAAVNNSNNSNLCQSYEDFKLNNIPDSENRSIELYNKLFQSEQWCDKACVDVEGHINPLCKSIFICSQILKADQQKSVAEKAEDHKLDTASQNAIAGLPEHKTSKAQESLKNPTEDQKPKSFVEDGLPTAQKLKSDNVKNITEKENAKSTLVEETVKEQHQNITPVRMSSGVKEPMSANANSDAREPVVPVVPDKQQGQMTDSKHPTSAVNSEGESIPLSNSVAKVVKDNTVKTVADGTEGSLQGNKASQLSSGHSVQNGSTAKKSEKSGLSNNSDKSTTSHSPDAPPKSTGNGKDEKVETAAKSKSQESTNQHSDVVEGNLPIETNNGKENKETDNSKKSEVDVKKMEELQSNKEQVLEPPTSSKAADDENSETNFGKQKANPINQNNDQTATSISENTDTAQLAGEDNLQKTMNEEISFTADTGDGAADMNTRFPVEPGESNDNIEFTGGGGTGIDYAKPASDVFDIEKNDGESGTVVYRDKYEVEDSHFFAYFMTTMVFCIVGYLLFHNKQKILALALEGRARRGRRRPNTSGYRKLDSNLEEAISSSKSASVTQVIY